MACEMQHLEARRLLSAVVVGRHLFYDNSRFDQYVAGPGAADDAAIAVDKHALLPGQTASFANYSSYHRGINGIMVDVANLASPNGITAADFSFATDRGSGTWQTAAAPQHVSVRAAAGNAGSDRITMTWADGAIEGQWLRVTVRATAATGLAVSDDFYFGNAIGEAGNSASNALVTSADELLARLNLRSPLNPAPITFAYDYNRDGLVNAKDQLIARSHLTSPLNGLPLLSMPAASVLHLRDEAIAAEAALVAVQATDDPQVIYDAFNAFARTHFGAAADPLIYEQFGHDLQFVAAAAWQHVSENSAALAFETNLPAVSYIEYGATSAYGQRTAPSDRAYYQHLHHLIGLQTGQTYHYRLVAIDERGQIAFGEDRTLTPQVVAGAIYLHQKADGSPHVLNQAGKTYILKEDLVVAGTAIDSQRDNITIDLNGHTITFAHNATSASNVYGIDIRGGYNGATQINGQGTNVRVLNGTIRQGSSDLLAGNTSSHAFNAVKATGADHQLAGLNIIYHASQSWGVQMNHSRGDVRIHHNIIRDTGATITNRHGDASRAIGWRYPVDNLDNNFRIDHNLIQRTRQNGISLANEMSHNEIYVDSWSTNSFAIQPNSELGIAAGSHFGNRVFATGYNPYGFGWAHEDLMVHDNLVHLFGLNVHQRWPENWGDVNLLAALRITNYSPGGQVRNNLHYYDNLILGFAKEGAQIEGTRFYSDTSIAGVEFYDNVVKVEALDAQTTEVAAIVAQGYFRKTDSLPIFYRDSTLISNLTLVQFGSAYGRGNNHQFERIEFVRVGDRPDFATFRFAGTYWSTGHVVLDGQFGPGTAPDDVYWEATGSQSTYAIKWTLDLLTAPGAQVTIVNADGTIEFSGVADGLGGIAAPLTQADIRPMEWLPTDGEEGRGVKRKDEHQKLLHTPHTITVTLDGRTATRSVEMTERRQMTIDDGELLPALTQPGAVPTALDSAPLVSGGRSWMRGPTMEHPRATGMVATSLFARTLPIAAGWSFEEQEAIVRVLAGQRENDD